eukprot:4263798-Lingulodinium_polyedra.AAC.1
MLMISGFQHWNATRHSCSVIRLIISIPGFCSDPCFATVPSASLHASVAIWVQGLLDSMASSVQEWASQHGGRLQRVAAGSNAPASSLRPPPLSAGGEPPAFDSFEAEYLLRLWSFGALPAHVLQSIAEAAVRDGNQKPAMLMLAGLGANGLYPNNCTRDFRMKLQLEKNQISAPWPVPVPVYDALKRRV